MMKANYSLSLLLVVWAVVGCSSFNRDWRKAVNDPKTNDPLCGPWTGFWTSTTSGHSDKLRCLISKSSDSEYQARFHAKYHKFLTFSYTAKLRATNVNEISLFSGKADLGRLAGGIYGYSGSSDGSDFRANYTSKYDNGVFEMQRPTDQ